MHAITVYRAATVVAIGTSLLMVWLAGAVGIVGIEGDGADLLYLGSIAVGIGGAVVAGLRAELMVRAALVTAAAVVLAGVVAIALDRHDAPASSVAEIMGLSAMFAAGYGLSAWLYHAAATGRAVGPLGPRASPPVDPAP